MTLNQAGIVVAVLFVICGGLCCIPWRRLKRGLFPPVSLPTPDRSTLRRPEIDPDWNVGTPRARFISSRSQLARLEPMRVCKLNVPARRPTAEEVQKALADELWQGQEGNV